MDYDEMILWENTGILVDIPSGYLKHSENGTEITSFPRKKMRFSICMLVYQRVPVVTGVNKAFYDSTNGKTNRFS